MLERMKFAVQDYIDAFDEYGPDPILAIDPKDFYMEIQTMHTRDMDIDDSDVTIEAAAVSQGLAEQDGMDYQSGRNWDIYPLHELLTKNSDGRIVPDGRKIEAIVRKYLRNPDNSRTPYTE